MVDSVNSGIGTQPTTTTATTSTGTTAGSADTVSEVSSGYSPEDSVSYSSAEGADAQSQDSSVELDSPAASTTTDSRDFLQKGFDSKLSSFRAIVADFNARFNADEVDLADTQTLLLVIKGMVSDTRALLNAETIDYSSSSRSLLQQRRIDAAKEQQQLKAEISSRNNQITDATGQIADNNLALAEKNAGRLAKEQAITAATDSGDTDLVTRLQSELADIETAITGLEQDSATLSTTIQGLQAANAISQTNLSLARQVIALVSEDFVRVRQLLGRVRERYDGEATDTGEEKATESKRENRQADIQRGQNEKRLRALNRNMKEIGGDIQGDQIRAAEKQAEATTLGPLPGVVSPAQIQALATLFPPEDPVVLLQKLRETAGQPSPQQLSEVSEALALILQATPAPAQNIPREAVSEPKFEDAARLAGNLSPEAVSNQQAVPAGTVADVTASEAKPGEDPHLGDNLSLEGASNPQAFSLLLLQRNMDVLKENVSDQSQLATLEMQQNIQVDNLFSELQQVEAMVAEALEESEKADAAIRRSPV